MQTPRKDRSDSDQSLGQTAWASARHAARLDTETSVWLRASLRPAFEASNTLRGLKARLAKKGVYLSQGPGGLILRDIQTRAAICSLDFLGIKRRRLQERSMTT